MLAKDIISIGIPAPVYVMTGKDAYLTDFTLEYFQKYVEADFRQFNYDVIEGGSGIGERIVYSCNTMPCGGGRRLVYVKEIASKPTENDLRLIKEYVSDPNPSTVLLINDANGLLVKLYKDIPSIDCSEMDVRETRLFISSYCREKGVEAESAALNALVDYCAGDLMRIVNELYKLSVYKEGKSIALADVKECVTQTVDYKLYEVSNALSSGRTGDAIAIMNALLRDGHKESELVAMLAGSYRNMLLAALSPLGDAEASKILGVKPYAVTMARRSAKNYGVVKLKEIVDALYGIEFDLKSGKISQESALNMTVMRVIT